MKKYLIFIVLLLISGMAFGADVAAVIPPTDNASVSIDGSLSNISHSLERIGIKLFFALALLQFAITGYGQIVSGDIEATIGKVARSLIWISFCVWLMTGTGDSKDRLHPHGAELITNSIQYFLGHVIGWASLSNDVIEFDAGTIISQGTNAVNKVINAMVQAQTPSSLWSGVAAAAAMIMTPTTPIVMLIYNGFMIGLTVILIFFTCGYVALKVIMVKIEAAIVVAIMPLSLAFLGLNAMRDQGFAPFKSALAIIYRIVILGAIIGAMVAIGDQLLDLGKSTTNPGNIWNISLTAVFSFTVLAFFAHKSDSIAASLANGSASLGSSDVAGAAMAGAAAAAAVAATGGAAVAAGSSSKVGQSMGDMMKSMLSGSGSISNAGSKGGGGTTDAAPTRSAPANASVKDVAGAPTRSGESAAPEPSSDTPSAASSSDSPTPTSQTASDAAADSSNSTAGIGGVSSNLEKSLSKIADSLGGAPKRPSLNDRIRDVGQHVANEKSATHVSINTSAGE